MKKLSCCLVIALVLCAGTVLPTTEISIAAAADLQFVMPELAKQFENQTGNKVKVSFGSSGNFASQIQNGAPFDLFFSADLSYPRRLDAAGFIAPGTIYHYANGKIVLWALKSSTVDIGRGLSVLADGNIHKIAIANPEHAPYGVAAVAAMKYENIYSRIQGKLVLAENISQAAQFVDSGSAEAGIVALSLVVAPTVRDKGNYFAIPENEYLPIEQGLAILKSSQHKHTAEQFVEFIKTPQAMALLRQFGFAMPNAK